MIKLKGQIHIPKIRGTIYRIAGEGSGGPLQAKTAYPSHTEQIIAPDEDYYGLVSVTFKPVPRVPALAVGVSEGAVAAECETVIPVSVYVAITAEDVAAS